MANLSRVQQLRRLLNPSTWRFMALVVTDPRWHPLYDSIGARGLEARFRDPKPWLAWHALPVLADEVATRRGQRVLEWGTGASTLWFHQQGMVVTGIEHDAGWFAACRAHLEKKADLRLIPVGSAYTNPDVDLSTFGVIVIDGRERNACAATVLAGIRDGRVTRDTLIVFDDTNRSRYAEAEAALRVTCRAHRAFSGPTSWDIDKLTTLYWV